MERTGRSVHGTRCAGWFVSSHPLLGHRRHRTAAGYAHLADAHLVEAAERVGLAIARAMRHRTAISAHASGGAVADAGGRDTAGVRRECKGVRDGPGQRMPQQY